MQAPRQTVPVQALRVARFVEAIAHERAIPSNAIAKTLRGTCAALCCDVLGVVARSPERTWSCSKLKKELPMRTILALATAVIAAFTAVAHAQQIEWEKVDAAFGRKAATTVGDVHRYGFPRSDLTVIHNHLLRANPETFYLHLGGHGDPAKMASAIHDALASSKTPLTPPAAVGSTPAIDLDTSQLEQIIGVKGQANAGVYQFGVPRRDQITMQGNVMTPAGPLGRATGVGFQPTGGGKAAITGDFVLLGSEVNPVITVLRANGIEVTALHSHMLDEQPRLCFMHFWANDDALKLARGMRATLDKTASGK